MATALRDPTLQLVFSRAFLLALERGNLESAIVFARASLKSRAPVENPAGRITYDET